MIVGCNNEINQIYYGAYTIDKVYACGGQLVYSGGTAPTPTPSGLKFSATYRTPITGQLQCDGNALAANEMYNSPMPTNINDIVTATFGACAMVVPSNALTNRYYLTAATIESGITRIEESAFAGCSGLTSIVVPSTVVKIYNNAFARCSGMTSVTLNEGLTEIGSTAFSGCSAINTIRIPNTVEKISSSAFRGCSGLTSVTIGTGVTRIEEYAFLNCSNLQTITIYATTPTSGAWSAFSGTNDCPIYVPAESLTAWKTTYPWTQLASRFQPIPT